MMSAGKHAEPKTYACTVKVVCAGRAGTAKRKYGPGTPAGTENTCSGAAVTTSVPVLLTTRATIDESTVPSVYPLKFCTASVIVLCEVLTPVAPFAGPANVSAGLGGVQGAMVSGTFTVVPPEEIAIVA